MSAPLAPQSRSGFYAALSSECLRKVIALCGALSTFETAGRDERGNLEATYVIGYRTELPIYFQDEAKIEDPAAGLIGWVVCVDEAMWEFVPYVAGGAS